MGVCLCLCSLARSLPCACESEGSGAGVAVDGGPLGWARLSRCERKRRGARARAHICWRCWRGVCVACWRCWLCVSVCVWPVAGGAAGSPGAERRHRSQIRVRIRASNPLVEGEEAPVRARRSNRTVAGARPAPRPVS